MDGRKSLKTHFFEHNWKNARPPEKTINSCHWCQLRLYPAHKQVTIVNDTGDGAELPKRFRFIMDSVLRPGVEPAEASFRSGCSCASAEACMYNGCECLSDMDSEDEQDSSSSDSGEEEEDEDEDEEEVVMERSRHRRQQKRKTKLTKPAKPSKPSKATKATRATKATKPARQPKLAYYSSGPRAGLLRSRFLHSRAPIYECHDGCACSQVTCANRVVERGRQIELQIFRTENRGWGVRTLVNVNKGQFVDRYVGEILTASEANRRRAAASMARRKDVYLFALDKFSDPDSLDQRLAGPPLEVDGEFLSGPTRFINHSCDPNLRIFARVGDHADKHIHDLALFAIRDIPAGTELTFDYVDGLEDMDSDARNPARRENMTLCLCQSEKCRGYLW